MKYTYWQTTTEKKKFKLWNVWSEFGAGQNVWQRQKQAEFTVSSTKQIQMEFRNFIWWFWVTFKVILSQVLTNFLWQNFLRLLYWYIENRNCKKRINNGSLGWKININRNSYSKESVESNSISVFYRYKRRRIFQNAVYVPLWQAKT